MTKTIAPRWVEPGSRRIVSEFCAWTSFVPKKGKEDSAYERPTRLHNSVECAMLNRYTLRANLRVVDVFEHPTTGEQYIINKKDGIRWKAEFCKTCHNQRKGAKK